MCFDCKEAHVRQKFFRNHHVTDLLEPSEKEIEECQNHRGEHMRYCCKPCHFRVCASCALEGHHGHEVSSLSDAVQDERSLLELAMSESKCVLDQKLSAVSERLANYCANIAQLTDALNVLANRLVALINEQREIALSAIETKTANFLQYLESEKARLEDLILRSHSSTAVAEQLLREGSDAEIYELSPVR